MMRAKIELRNAAGATYQWDIQGERITLPDSGAIVVFDAGDKVQEVFAPGFWVRLWDIQIEEDE